MSKWSDVGVPVSTGHVLIAPDKFKGSLSASGVAAQLAAGLSAVRPHVRVLSTPVADGGEGTVDAAVAAGYLRVPVEVTGPTGERVQSAIAVRGLQAVVELAAASGLDLLPHGRPDPLRASSRGTGELITAALDHDCTEVILGIGGSACTDGGAGLLQALGARLQDAAGEELAPGGAALAMLDRLNLQTLDGRLGRTRFVLASDVDNPLLGPRGAACVYAPQKGASPDDVALLESGFSGGRRRSAPALPTCRGQARPVGSATARSPCWPRGGNRALMWCSASSDSPSS